MNRLWLLWLLSCLWAGSPAWADPTPALTWTVPDEATRSATEAALQALWPDSDLQVVVGEPSDADVGVQTVEGEVRLVREGRVLAAATAGPEEAVVLLRSWLREHAREVGWVPEVQPEPEPEPEPELVFDVTPDEEVDEALLPEHRVYLGMGLRDAMVQPGVVDGFRLLGQVALADWHAVGGELMLGFNRAAVSQLDEDIAAVDPERNTLTSRVDAFAGSAGWHVWLPLPARSGTWATPRLSGTAAVEVRQTILRETTIREDGVPEVVLVTGSGALDVGLLVGGGVTVRLGGSTFLERLLVRAHVLDQMRIPRRLELAEEELEDPRTHEPTVTVDLLIAPVGPT